MTGTPFDSAGSSIPVTVVTKGDVPPEDKGQQVLVLDPALHDHPAGQECVACAAAIDIRAKLFDVLQQARADGHPLHSVVVDARQLKTPQTIVDRLNPQSPAVGLRDHTVMKSFHLARVL
jgi:hypothetical protein